ncbi:cell envelope integrity protein TolA [Thiotrichales bacterium HSG1]|nr:cell envelope integrity protein TolA [Thiotrichales bacterium HSG1]
MIILAFIQAIIINILFLILIFFSVEGFKQSESPPKLETIMPASIVDETHIKKNIRQPAVKLNLESKKHHLEKKVTSAEKLLSKTEKKKKREQKILNKILKQKAIETKKLAKERKKAKKLAASLEAKKKLAKEHAEAKRLAEELALAKEVLDKQEALKLEQSVKEETIEKSVDSERDNERIQEVIEILTNEISQHWVRPRGFYGGLSCVIKITLQTGGIKVEIVTSSGNVAFDYSAKLAVEKASPLPIPEELLTEFQEFNFNFEK